MVRLPYGILLYLVVASFNSLRAEDRGKWWEVTTAQGPLVGRMDPSGDFYDFYKIPYASIPKGNKFKAPKSPPTWKRPLYALDENVICPQYFVKSLLPEGLMVQDNCLVANVHVPVTEVKNLPVLVYVHGGAFQFGYGEWGQTKNLLKTKKAIVVTFNYRLGIPGFLCLGTDDIPGNAGMKDQVALLQWVQRNIAAFGGNPNDVTLAGYSAGSASVDLLILSKSAKGLFHKVIPESGGNLAAATIQLNPLQNAMDYALSLNFTNVDDIYALEKFYKTLPDDLLRKDSFMDIPDSTLMFSPCIERDTGKDAFLTESPFSILKNSDYTKVPMLYGFTNMEGQLRIPLFEIWKNKMNDKFSDFLPANLEFNSESEKEEVAKQIREFYFGDKPVNNDNILGYVDYFSDVMYVYPMLRAVKLHIKAGHERLYLYEYSFVDEDTPVIPHTIVRGAPHVGQTFAVHDGRNFMNLDESNLTQEHINMKKTMREIWLNFVETGEPVSENSSLPEWPAVKAESSPHMSLGQKIELRGTLLKERMQFWDSIYEKYCRPPIPPPEPKRKTHLEL